MKKRVFFIARIALTIALAVVLFKFVPYSKLSAIFRSADKRFLSAGFGVFFTATVLVVMRWRYILCELGTVLSRREAFLSFFSGLFFNLFFPSSIAGDVFRAASISYRHGHTHRVASSVFLDRYTGAVSLALVASTVAVFSIKKNIDPRILIAVYGFLAAVAAGSLAIFSRRVFKFLTRIVISRALHAKIVKFHDELYYFRRHPPVFFKSLLFSFTIHILTCYAFYLNGLAFGLKISFVDYVIIVPLLMAVAFIPVTVAGAGTREAASIYFFALVGIAPGVALSLSLLNLAALIAVSILGGLIYLAFYHKQIQIKAIAREA